MQYDRKQINRIKRIQGQLNGVLKMMEEERDCKSVITQLSASKNSIGRLMAVIVSENLIECINELDGEDRDERISEAVELLVKSK
ncbi:MAG TPA: metal-sensitive transcriptional regulator [Candidatus Nosocomiicoccus stercorigallinarum]|nr:metal-sensitive transcriptional regulator [Candidatus Nosocomiicoccus stercorigallinarum]